MDNEPLWSQDELGHYWLLFPNKHALSMSEIREIFSEFGKIKNITTAGDEKGFRFVQYTSIMDVERAVESLADHPKVTLIPHRPKNNKNRNASSAASQSGQSVVEENTKRSSSQRKQVKGNHANSDENSKSYKSVSPEQTSNHDTYSISSSGTMSIPKENFKSYQNNQESAATSTSFSNGNMSPQKNTLERAKMLLKLRGTNANSFLPNSMTNGNSRRNTKQINDYEDEIPDLVTKPVNKIEKVRRKIILNAEEIVVANIHENYTSAFMLHLFEQFEPLAVSFIKIVPHTETRYCHVYFKSVEDSLGVETQFDNYSLMGKKLVVLRPCRLLEEALSNSP